MAVNHNSRPGARIRVFLNGSERVNTILEENSHLHLRAREFTMLKAGDTVEYVENGVSKIFTVPANRIWLVEWELVKKEMINVE